MTSRSLETRKPLLLDILAQSWDSNLLPKLVKHWILLICTWGQRELKRFVSRFWRFRRRPVLSCFSANSNHWCHWLESAEHMDPLRHHGTSFLPPLALARARPSFPLSQPTASPVPPGRPGVGQYGARRNRSKTKLLLLMYISRVKELEHKRHTHKKKSHVFIFQSWNLI